MNRNQRIVVAVGVVVIVSLTSCGRKDQCRNCARVKEELAQAQRTIAALEAERDAPRRTALHPGGLRMVRDGVVPVEQPVHDGQILSVDSSANAAVISLGSVDGVQFGFRYTVSRGSLYVATIEITDVQTKVSAGRSIKSLSKLDIQVGDQVMSR